MVQQLTVKLLIEPSLCLASIDTDFGIYSFHGEGAIAIASFVNRYIDTDLELPNTNIMGSVNENKGLVDQLLADARNMLQNSFDEGEYREVLAIVERASLKGLLGASKSCDSCLDEVVNIANDILRNRDIDETELSTISRQPKALYVYVALVAVGLISA
jgi:hypothetical protein